MQAGPERDVGTLVACGHEAIRIAELPRIDIGGTKKQPDLVALAKRDLLVEFYIRKRITLENVQRRCKPQAFLDRKRGRSLGCKQISRRMA
ncbi:hypothetical protein D9M72_633460 [compost metagenome]